MSQFDSTVAQRLAKMIAANVAKETSDLCSGALNIEQYRDKTGYIRALKDVTESLAEIEHDINQGK